MCVLQVAGEVVVARGGEGEDVGVAGGKGESGFYRPSATDACAREPSRRVRLCRHMISMRVLVMIAFLRHEVNLATLPRFTRFTMTILSCELAL